MRTLAILILTAPAAACSDRVSRPEEDGKAVIVVPESPATTTSVKRPAPAATGTLPPSDVRAYAVPPLPPELQDDGDLTPLPPRPSPADLAAQAPPQG